MPPEPGQSAPPPYQLPTPPTSPPPQMPNSPYPFSNDGLSPEQSVSSAQYIKARRPWLLRGFLMLLILAMVAGAGFLYRAYRNTPSAVFNAALGNSLDTKQVKESISASTSAVTLSFDFKNNTDPRLSTLTTKSLGANTYVKGYGSLQNTYVSFASDPAHSASTPANLLDQWIQVRENGTLPVGVHAADLFTNSDPHTQLLGPWIVGNFSGKTRSSLLKAAKNLYQFDSKTVKHLMLNGQAVLAYSLTLDGSKLAAYESQAGTTFTVPATDSAADTQGLGGAKVAMTVYVSQSSRRVVRADTTLNGVTTTVTYGGYNATSVPGEPTPALTYSDYLKNLGS